MNLNSIEEIKFYVINPWGVGETIDLQKLSDDDFVKLVEEDGQVYTKLEFIGLLNDSAYSLTRNNTYLRIF